jgi:hypothetical protein
MLEHVLGEHVNVRDCDRADRARRFPVTAEGHPATRIAAEAGAEAAVALLSCLGGEDPREHIRAAAALAVGLLVTVEAAAHTAQPDSFSSVGLSVVTVFLGDEAIK